MIGSLCLVRDAVMVSMSTMGAHFSNKVRMRDLYGSVKKKKRLQLLFNRLIVISFGYEQEKKV
jgi:hypothetical protein